MLEELKKAEFVISDLGICKHFLGMTICQTESEITMSQSAYVEEICKESTPIGDGKCPSRRELDSKEALESKSTNSTAYRALVGSLRYLATCTRPDISYITSQLGIYQSEPTEVHMQSALETLGYLKATKHYGIHFSVKREPEQSLDDNCIPFIECFTDGTWASCKRTRRSAHCIKIDGHLVDWASSTQQVVALSSCESELMYLTGRTRSTMFLTNLIGEIENIQVKIKLWCDNQSTLKLCKNPELHQRTKHIELKQFFVRDFLENNESASAAYIESSRNPADIFTKVGGSFSTRIMALGLKDLTYLHNVMPTWEC